MFVYTSDGSQKLNSMKDFLKQPLEIGDHVILLKSHRRTFQVGEIIAFTDKNVRIKISKSRRDSVVQPPNRVVKILSEQMVWYKLASGE
jgi:hypothetical protein